MFHYFTIRPGVLVDGFLLSGLVFGCQGVPVFLSSITDSKARILVPQAKKFLDSRIRISLHSPLALKICTYFTNKFDSHPPNANVYKPGSDACPRVPLEIFTEL